jgi:hypothetical protein
METRDGAAFWTLREIEDVNMARVRALLDDELTSRDIADETGLSKSTVDKGRQAVEPMPQAESARRSEPVMLMMKHCGLSRSGHVAAPRHTLPRPPAPNR